MISPSTHTKPHFWSKPRIVSFSRATDVGSLLTGFARRARGRDRRLAGSGLRAELRPHISRTIQCSRSAAGTRP